MHRVDLTAGVETRHAENDAHRVPERNSQLNEPIQVNACARARALDRKRTVVMLLKNTYGLASTDALHNCVECAMRQREDARARERDTEEEEDGMHSFICFIEAIPENVSQRCAYTMTSPLLLSLLSEARAAGLVICTTANRPVHRWHVPA